MMLFQLDLFHWRFFKTWISFFIRYQTKWRSWKINWRRTCVVWTVSFLSFVEIKPYFRIVIFSRACTGLGLTNPCPIIQDSFHCFSNKVHRDKFKVLIVPAFQIRLGNLKPHETGYKQIIKEIYQSTFNHIKTRWFVFFFIIHLHILPFQSWYFTITFTSKDGTSCFSLSLISDCFFETLPSIPSISFA